tara:strand:+ start:1680 stop:2615 length:936 start_codon:yes stop_codon:yes gene_type:complete
MHKKLSILLSILSIGLSAQTWTSSVVNDPWDGDYQIAFTIGSGGKSPYANPVLRIEKPTTGLNIYIKNLGYTGCANNLLEFIFDDERKYRARGTSSTTQDAIFIETFSTYENKESLTVYHLLNELTKSSNLQIRFTSNCSLNTFSFGLSGSSRAVFSVLSKDIIFTKTQFFDSRDERAKIKSDSISKFNKIKSDSISKFKETIRMKNDSIKSTLKSEDEILNDFITNPCTFNEKLKGFVFNEKEKIQLLIEKELSFNTRDYGEIVKIYIEESSPGFYRLYGQYLKDAELKQGVSLYKVFQINKLNQLFLLE